jgi:DUF971 family protein
LYSCDQSNKLRDWVSKLAIVSVMQPVVESAAQTVSIQDGGRGLRINLSDGTALDLPADRLRMNCRCAVCTRARIDGKFAPATEGIEIAQATPIGHYGLNIAFSDDHARGIFPFVYLVELAAFEAMPGKTLVEAASAAS